VRKLEKRDMFPANTVPIDSHASATLRYIRNSMEAATAFAVPGSAGVAMGMVGLLATALSLMPGFAARWLGIWLLAALVAALIGGVLIIRPASIRALALSGTPVRKFALCLLPSLFVGAVLTAVLVRYDALNAIPGTWLLLYGCSLIAASVPTTRTIGAMGTSFMLFGLLALLLPHTMQILMLGAGFGGLHILFGLLISRRSHGRET
jgi:hypothetical protein